MSDFELNFSTGEANERLNKFDNRYKNVKHNIENSPIRVDADTKKAVASIKKAVKDQKAVIEVDAKITPETTKSLGRFSNDLKKSLVSKYTKNNQSLINEYSRSLVAQEKYEEQKQKRLSDQFRLMSSSDYASRKENQSYMDTRRTPMYSSGSYKDASNELKSIQKELKEVGQQAELSRHQIDQMLNRIRMVKASEPVNGKVTGELANGKTYGTDFINKANDLEQNIKSLPVKSTGQMNANLVSKRAKDNQKMIDEWYALWTIKDQQKYGSDIVSRATKNRQNFIDNWYNAWAIKDHQKNGSDIISKAAKKNQDMIDNWNQAWTVEDQQKYGSDTISKAAKSKQKFINDWFDTWKAPERSDAKSDTISQSAKDRQTFIDNWYDQFELKNQRSVGSDIVSKAAREKQDFIDAWYNSFKIDQKKSPTSNDLKNSVQDYVKTSNLGEDFKFSKDTKDFSLDKDEAEQVVKQIEKYKKSMNDVSTIQSRVALGEKQISEYTEKQSETIEKRLKTLSKENGLIWDITEKEQLRKTMQDDLLESYDKKLGYIEKDRSAGRHLSQIADEQTSKLKDELKLQAQKLQQVRKIESLYRQRNPNASADSKILTNLKTTENYHKQIIKDIASELSHQKKMAKLVKDTGLDYNRILHLQDKYNDKLETANDYMSLHQASLSEGDKKGIIQGYGENKPPNWNTYGRGSGGGSGGGSDSGYIDQVPQNPLLGRFAQWGMMASGFAATIFVIQMLGAQLANLMAIITTWEDSLLEIIDSTDLTGKDMDRLSKELRGYATDLGITREQAAGSYSAAAKYGIRADEENIGQLSALKYSSQVGSYEDAATIMAMAGTQLGDTLIAKFTEAWDKYSGKGETSGSFGYEWEQLKGASTNSLIDLFQDSKAQYGKQLTDFMKTVSTWIKSNQPKIESFVDIVASGVQTISGILKAALPGLLAFAAGFSFFYSGKIVFDFLKTVSSSLMVISSIALSAGTSVTGLAGAFGALSASVSACLPALIAMGAIWAGWELYKKYEELKKTREAFKSLENINLNNLKDLSIGDLQNKLQDSTLAIKKLKDDLSKLNAQKEKYLQNSNEWNNSALIQATDKNIDKITVRLKQELSIRKQIQDQILRTTKEIERQKEVERAAGMGLELPEYINSIEEWKSILQEVNDEYGVMPKVLADILAAQEKITRQSKISATSPGTVVLQEEKNAFDRSMEMDPIKKAQYDIALNRKSLATPGGMNEQDKEIEKLKTVRDNMADELSQFSKEERKTSVRAKELAAGIAEVRQNITNLSVQSGTQYISQFDSALKGLSETTQDLNKTDFEKKVSDIMRNYRYGTADLIAEQREILTHSLKENIEKLKGVDTELAGKLRDIQSSNLSVEDKSNYTEYLKNQNEISKLQVKINIEKSKGYKYTSDTQLEYGKMIDNLRAMSNFKLGIISQKTLDMIVKYNNELAEFNKQLNQAKAKQAIGKVESITQGYTSDKEMQANVKIRQDNFVHTLERLDVNNEKSPNYMTKAEQNALVEKNNKYIYADERTKQAKSFMNYSKQIDSDIGKSGLSSLSVEATEDYIRKKTELLKELGYSEREQVLYSQEALIQLEEDKNAGRLSMWEDFYYERGVLEKDHHEYLMSLADMEYEHNKLLYGKTIADKIKEQDQLDAANLNRRNLEPKEDVGVAFKNLSLNLSKEYQTLGQIIETTIGNSIDTVTDGLWDWISGTKSAKDAFKSMALSMLTDIGKMIIKQQLLNLLIGSGGEGSSGGIVGAISGMFGFATGGVLSGSGISSLSNSVVGSATILPDTTIRKYATGTAMIGEAGYEAVMPLTRLPSGNLGVETSGMNTSGGDGGGVSVVLNVKNNGQAVQAEQDGQIQWDAQNKKLVLGIVLSALENNSNNFRSTIKAVAKS